VRTPRSLGRTAYPLLDLLDHRRELRHVAADGAGVHADQHLAGAVAGVLHVVRWPISAVGHLHHFGLLTLRLPQSRRTLTLPLAPLGYGLRLLLGAGLLDAVDRRLRLPARSPMVLITHGASSLPDRPRRGDRENSHALRALASRPGAESLRRYRPRA
jgi:hypothetical protein